MSWGTFDISGIKGLQAKINKIASSDIQKFMIACSKDLAARLLRYATMRTPVDTGNLWRNWSQVNNGVEVAYSGGVYTVDIINPVEYASYVEYGHRTRSGGWVPGRFMLKISEDELKGVMPQILEDKILEFLNL